MSAVLVALAVFAILSLALLLSYAVGLVWKSVSKPALPPPPQYTWRFLVDVQLTEGKVGYRIQRSDGYIHAAGDITPDVAREIGERLIQAAEVAEREGK